MAILLRGQLVGVCGAQPEECLLAALYELDNGNTISWVEPGDLNHISESIPPQAIPGRYYGLVSSSRLDLPLQY